MPSNKTTTNLPSLILCAAFLLFGAPVGAQKASAPQPQGSKKSAELAHAAELYTRAKELYAEGKYGEAMVLVREVLAIREKALGPDHPDVAQSLNILAILHYSTGEYAKALLLFERALAIREKALDPDHPDVAQSMDNLAVLYQVMSEYAKALPLYERALAIREKALGPDHPDVASSLNNLAAFHQAMGEYAKVLPLYERAWVIREKALGPDHADVGESLNNLAAFHQAAGESARALPLYERALAIREKALGPDHPDVAEALHNLASLHQDMGESARALPLAERALVIKENTLGPVHPDVAKSLNSLAAIRRDMGEYAKALPLEKRALAIREKALGPDHPVVAKSLNSLVLLYEAMGEYAKALPLCKRALAIREKVLGPEHRDVAASLNNLALLHWDMGEYAKALPLFERALAIKENSLGPGRPEVAMSLANLAMLYWAMGEYAKVLPLFEHALSIEARYLGQWLHSGSAYQRHRRIASFSLQAEWRVSFHLSSTLANHEAARPAVESILLYKGRVLESMVHVMRAAHLDADPEGRAMLEELRGAHATLSRLFLQGPGDDTAARERYRQRRVELERTIDELEAKLSARSERYRRLREPVTVATLQERLPGDVALIEFFVYRPYDAKATGESSKNRWGEPHYAAYIIRPRGPVHGVDLGPVAALDEAVLRLRGSWAGYQADANKHARALHARVMQPLEAHLGDATRVYVAPAGQLGFVPFAALVDQRGRYLVERYSLSYWASGRQLAQTRSAMDARAAEPDREPRGDIIIANPSFGVFGSTPAATEISTEVTNGSLSRNYADIRNAAALPGTASEAENLQALLPGSTAWTRAEATETAVKSVHGPRILHLATHGFFLPDQALERDVMAELSASGMPVKTGIYERLGVPGHRVPVENALLRSGLLLAGANEHRDPAGDNDGVLTALEVSAMDLAGTRLVVLSACDTGIGGVGASQGLYGLRWAFAVAGAETLVMSLWKVDDRGTQDVMTRYYQYLLAGEGRAEAMRRVQLDYLRAGGHRAHPYYWASFVVSGDDSTMAGQPARLAAHPTVRGSACAGCRADDGSPGLWLCVLVLLAALPAGGAAGGASRVVETA